MDFDWCHLNVILLQVFIHTPSSTAIIATLIIFVLIFFSAILSASEIAYFSLTNAEVGALQESEDKVDNRVAELLERPRYLLSSIVLTNNLMNIGVVITSYFVTRRMLTFQNLVFQQFTIPAYILEFIWNLAVVTFVLVLFGEAIPKVYATHNKVKIARFMSQPLALLIKICSPVNYVLVGGTKMLEKRLKKYNAEIDIEEINKAIEITVEKKESKQDAKLLKGIVHFGNITVKQVMRPRTEVAAINVELSFTQVMDYVRETGYSRYPVYKETPDNIKGVLNVKDLLEHLNQDEDFGWQSLLHEPSFVPENKKIDDLLREIQENRKHLVIVVDEFGGTAGIITLEDIIEEVVGDITDEFDDHYDSNFRRLDDRNFLFDGKTTLSEVSRLAEIDPEVFADIKGEAETLGGLILEVAGRIPRNGEEIKSKHFKFGIISVTNNRIERVRLTNETPVPENNHEEK